MTLRALLPVLLLGVAPAAGAHHAFAPHFDSDKPVVITGEVVEFERRNPHAYLHVSAVDENGLTREYVCESHGVTQLSRNGIRPEMLAPGTVVTLTGTTRSLRLLLHVRRARGRPRARRQRTARRE
jgi:hypothetical protein